MKCLNITRWMMAGALALTLVSCGNDSRRAEPVVLESETRATELQPAEALNLLHKANLKEIALGTLAAEKAKSEALKKFAEHLTADHKAADAKVTETAKALEIELEAFDAPADAAVEKLKPLEGEAFEKACLETMVADHEALVTQLEGAKVADEKVMGLITDLLPTIKAHQAEAEKMLGGSTDPEMGDKGQEQAQEQKQQEQKQEQGKEQDQGKDQGQQEAAKPEVKEEPAQGQDQAKEEPVKEPTQEQEKDQAPEQSQKEMEQ